MIDSVTLLQAASPNAHALENEQMIFEELSGRGIDPDTWRRELRDCLVDNYRGVLKIGLLQGRPQESWARAVSP
jgi:hypothetical protein